jgi:hypothetical protein
MDFLNLCVTLNKYSFIQTPKKMITAKQRISEMWKIIWIVLKIYSKSYKVTFGMVSERVDKAVIELTAE